MRHRHGSLVFLAGLAGVVSIAVASCGGSKKGDPAGPGTPGEPGEPAPDGAEPGVAADAGMPPDAALPPAAMTFVLTNSGTQELALNLDHGWGAVIRAYSGKPPKAKPILMYPKPNTASCDSPPEEICPVIEKLEKVADIRAAEKRQLLAPGASVEARWDAKVYVYEKARGTQDGKKARCECWRQAEAPPEAYTVQAFGLRLSTTVGTNSQPLPSDPGTMTIPVSEPARVDLVFPDPPAAKPTKGKK